MYVVRSRMGLMIVLAASIGFILYCLPFLLLKDDSIITNQIRAQLQKSLSYNGLEIEIGNVHWDGWNSITCNRIELIDPANHITPLQIDRLTLRFNLLALLRRPRNPEAALQDMELVKPALKIIRFKDGTINFQHYFPPKQKQLWLESKFLVKEGYVEYQDQLYGDYTLTGVRGTVDARNNPIWSWRLSGVIKAPGKPDWKSSGKFRIYQGDGRGSLAVKQLDLSEITGLLPETYRKIARNGKTAARVEFAWKKGKFWIENVAATVEKADLVLPQLKKPIYLKYLALQANPNFVQVERGELYYNDTRLRANGFINNRDFGIELDVKGERLKLTELIDYYPALRAYQISGSADFSLKISGNLDAPVADGKVSLRGGQLTPKAGLTVKQIAGEYEITKNNLRIIKMQGNWGEAVVDLSGRIQNIFNPSLDLRIKGVGLDLNQVGIPEVAGVSVGKTASFDCAITGNIQKPLIEGELHLERLSYQDTVVEDVKIGLALDAAAKSLTIYKLRGLLWDGLFEAKGRLSLSQNKATWKFHGDMSGLNLSKATLSKQMDISGKVSTNAVLSGSWQFGQTFDPGVIFGSFSSENLTYNGLTVAKAEGVFSWREGRLQVEAIHAQTGQGRAYGHLSLDRNYLAADFNAEQVKISELQLEHPHILVDGVFDGNISLNGPLTALTGEANGSFTGVSWGSKPIGDFLGRLNYTDQKLSVTDLKLTADSGEYQIGGDIGWEGEPVFDLRITSNNVNLNGFAQWLPLDRKNLKIDGNGQINFSFYGKTSNPGYSGTIDLDRPTLGDFNLEKGRIELEGNLQEVSIKKLELSGKGSTIELFGKASQKRLNLYIIGQNIRLADFKLGYDQKVLAGEVNLAGKLTGDPARPDFLAEITGSNIAYGNINYQKLTGKIQWNGKEVKINQAELSNDASVINLYGQITKGKPIQLNLGVKVVSGSLRDLVSSLKLPITDTEGDLSGLIRVVGPIDDPSLRIIGNITNGKLYNTPVTGEFDLFYKKNEVQIEQIQLRHDTGFLLAKGSWSNGKSLKLQVQLQEFPLEAINFMVRPQAEFGGKANADIFLELSDTKISGTYSLKANELIMNKVVLGSLYAGGSISGQGVTISDLLIGSKNGMLTGAGYLPWPVEQLQKLKLPVKMNNLDRHLNLQLNLKNVPVELINVYAQNFAVSSGNLDGSLTLTGNLKQPELAGELTCDSVKIHIPALPYPIEGFKAVTRIKQNNLIIEQASGNYGKNGKITLDGGIKLLSLTNPDYNLSLNGKHVYFRNPNFDGYLNLNLKLQGKMADSFLSGEAEIYNCKIGMLTIVRQKSEPVVWNPKFDLGVSIGKNVRYRQIGLADIPINGNLKLRGDLISPQMSGEAVSQKGVLTFYGQTFKIDRAKAVFKYSQGVLPYIEVDSSVFRSKAVIFLIIKGQIGENLLVSLSSQPYMSQSDLYALLNWSELSGDQPLTFDGMVSSNISMVYDTVFGELFYQLRKALNVDYLYLEHDYRQNDFRISVGDFVTRKLFVSYSYSVATELPKPKWDLEYHLTPKLVAGGRYSLEEGKDYRLVYRLRF